MKNSIYIFFFVTVILFVPSCTGKKTNRPAASKTADGMISVQFVRKTSDLISIEKIFGENLKAIQERNEILLQTGVIDTTDEQSPIKTAIVQIEAHEVILTFVQTFSSGGNTIEIYSGQGYNLILTYAPGKTAYNTAIYIGQFIIKKDKFQKEYTVTGWDGNL